MPHHPRFALPRNHGLLTVGRGAVTVGALALVTVVGGGVAAAHLDHRALAAAEPAPVTRPDARAGSSARTDGFDPTTCHPQPAAPDAGAPAAGTGAGATVVVTFVVPATTRIDVDDLGRPVAVSTNTGQAPCITDQFTRVAPDGTATPADQELSTAVLSVHLGEDWQPGARQPFPAG